MNPLWNPLAVLRQQQVRWVHVWCQTPEEAQRRLLPRPDQWHDAFPDLPTANDYCWRQNLAARRTGEPVVYVIF